MIIRKAKIQDVPALLPIFEEYRRFYGMESNIQGAKQFLNDRISGIESQVFIAVDELDKIIGFVQLYPLYSSTRLRRLWLLNDLFVLEDQRSKGIAKKLIERSKILCRQTKACGLILETSKTNATANALYPITGFTLDQEHNYYSWDV